MIPRGSSMSNMLSAVELEQPTSPLKSSKGGGGIFRRNASAGKLNKLTNTVSPRIFGRHRSQLDLKDIMTKIDEADHHSSLPMLDFKPLKSCMSNSSLSTLMMTDSSSNHSSITSLSSSKMTRSVSFTNIEIREYPRTLGRVGVDGMPELSLDWYIDNDDNQIENPLRCKTLEVSVDHYENTREPRRPRPPIVSKAKREKLLRDFGITYDDIKIAEKECRAEKKNNENNDNVKVRDVMSKVVKRMKNGGTNESQVELDELMRRSSIADRIRQKQMELYVNEQQEILFKQQKNSQSMKDIVSIWNNNNSDNDSSFFDNMKSFRSDSITSSSDYSMPIVHDDEVDDDDDNFF